MKQILLFLCISTAIAGKCTTVIAQCPNTNTQFGTTAFDVVYGDGFHTLDTCFNGGQYALVNVVIGKMYTFRTCGDEDFDTEITLYNNAGGSPLVYNDDACVWQSSISWLATFTGQIRVLVNRFPCGSQAECMRLQAWCGDPCQYSVPFHTDTTLVTCSTIICDHGGNENYDPSADGYMVITPSISGMNIQLNGTLDSELLYDGVLFYDGVGLGGANLGTWSGTGNLPVATSLSGSLTIRFVSDPVDEFSGFSFGISCVAPVSIDPISMDDNYILWPNPNNGNFNIRFFQDADVAVVITIVDRSGREIIQRSATGTGFEQILSLNYYGQLSSGMYFLRIQGKQVQTVKFIVQ